MERQENCSESVRILFCDNVNITELITLLFPPEAWKLPEVGSEVGWKLSF